jgi:phage tail tape-measure protein
VPDRLEGDPPALLLPRGATGATWRGEPAQGAFIVGEAAPGTRLSLDGRAVRVSAGGQFAFGFGRDHGPSATLAVTLPGGRAEQRSLPVARPRHPQRPAGELPARQSGNVTVVQ